MCATPKTLNKQANLLPRIQIPTSCSSWKHQVLARRLLHCQIWKYYTGTQSISRHGLWWTGRGVRCSEVRNATRQVAKRISSFVRADLFKKSNLVSFMHEQEFEFSRKTTASHKCLSAFHWCVNKPPAARLYNILQSWETDVRTAKKMRANSMFEKVKLHCIAHK